MPGGGKGLWGGESNLVKPPSDAALCAADSPHAVASALLSAVDQDKKLKVTDSRLTSCLCSPPCSSHLSGYHTTELLSYVISIRNLYRRDNLQVRAELAMGGEKMRGRMSVNEKEQK